MNGRKQNGLCSNLSFLGFGLAGIVIIVVVVGIKVARVMWPAVLLLFAHYAQCGLKGTEEVILKGE